VTAVDVARSLKVVVAEDSPVLRRGLVELLGEDGSVEVVASCATYSELIDAVERCRPEVVLTDIRMPPTGTDEGVRAARYLREVCPDIGVVVLSQYDQADYVRAVLEGGSRGRGYLLKEHVSDEAQLVAAVHHVAVGGSYIDPSVVDVMMTGRGEGSRLDRLSRREREILTQVAEGKNNAAIGEALAIGERAVEKHINSIFSKLELAGEEGVHRRVKAVVLFLTEAS
jgi:DNA-binding NarL/FixJ family response regulator